MDDFGSPTSLCKELEMEHSGSPEVLRLEYERPVTSPGCLVSALCVCSGNH